MLNERRSIFTDPEPQQTVCVDFDGQRFEGRYRVMGAVLIAYYADQVKFAELQRFPMRRCVRQTARLVQGRRGNAQR
jgi:hypothetical protein